MLLSWAVVAREREVVYESFGPNVAAYEQVAELPDLAKVLNPSPQLGPLAGRGVVSRVRLNPHRLVLDVTQPSIEIGTTTIGEQMAQLRIAEVGCGEVRDRLMIACRSGAPRQPRGREILFSTIPASTLQDIVQGATLLYGPPIALLGRRMSRNTGTGLKDQCACWLSLVPQRTRGGK